MNTVPGPGGSPPEGSDLPSPDGEPEDGPVEPDASDEPDADGESGNLPPDPAAGEHGPGTRLTAIVGAAFDGDPHAMDVLAAYLIKKVERVATRFLPRQQLGTDRAQSVSDATIDAVVKAVATRRFEPARDHAPGVATKQFVKYLITVFRNRLVDALRAEMRQPKHGPATNLHILPASSAANPARLTELKEQYDNAIELIDEMSEPNRTIVFSRLVMELTFTEISQTVELTAQRVGQIYRDELERLKRWLR